MDSKLAAGKPQSGALLTFYLYRAFVYIRRYWFVYLLAVPGIIQLLIFKYGPMNGILIAFKNYSYKKGVWGSDWVGFKHFSVMFQSKEFYRVLGNTVVINLLNIAIGFTFVLLLALLINEIKLQLLKRSIQTLIYLPHFLSWVVFAGIVINLLSPSEGAINKIIVFFGGEPIYFLAHPEYFKAILVLSSMIKEAGFDTIIYLAAIASVNPHLYESAVIDGANRVQLIRYITLPRIMPTVAVLLILRMASLFGSNFDQVFNLYNPLLYETGDVLSTYLYRTGLLEGKFEMSTALGLVFGLIGLALIYFTNRIIRRMNVTGIF